MLIDKGNKYRAMITTTKVDVSDAQQVDSWIKDTVSLFGKLDGAANIAGIAGGDGQTTEAIVRKKPSALPLVMFENLSLTSCFKTSKRGKR